MDAPKFKPLLAYTIEDTSKLPYPVVSSYKYDGIRVIVIDGVVYSRSMKPIRSKTVQKLFGKQELNWLDGEIIYGPPNAENVFNLTTRSVMSTDLPEGFDERELKFYAFDEAIAAKEPFDIRSGYVINRAINYEGDNLVAVQHKYIADEAALLAYEAEALDFGMEGLMVRSILGTYKQGRSTAKEGIIGKLKRFSDDEAIVVGFEEKLRNTNEKLKNELGYSQRSQAQEGMVGADTLGALVCECNGIHFTMGSGFDDAGRAGVWQNKEKYLGKLAKFKYFAVGMKDSYRFPIFLGWRDGDDL